MDDKERKNRRDTEEARLIRNMEHDEVSDEILEAKWKIMKGAFKREYSDLTDEDLTYRQGEFGLMLGRIGKKTGISERRLRSTIFNWNDSRGF